MNFHFFKQKGITLLEVLLVLAIGGSIVVLGLNQYYTFKASQDVRLVNANVDRLFLGLLNYYRANCKKDGLLDPTKTIGYINPSQLPGIVWPPVAAPFIDYNDVDQNGDRTYGYRVQFRNYQPSATTRDVYWCLSGACNSPAQQIKKQGSVALQLAMVAVKIKDVSKAVLYSKLLGADCVSGPDASGKFIAGCGAIPSGPAQYLVWERQPSVGAFSTSSGIWLTTQRLRQFNQQYTNDDNYAAQVDDPTWNGNSRYEDYLCTGS